MNTNDPRLNLPSASGFEVDCLCHGRQQLLRRITKPDEISDPDADFGRAIHKARETGDATALTEEQVEVYAKGIENEKKIVARWCQDFNITHYKEGPREARFWFNNPETLDPMISAQLDVHYIGGDYLLIVDWKTLWCTNLTPAERNWQGRIQTVVGAREYDSKHVRMSFNKAMFSKEDTVDYSSDHIAHAETSLLYQLWEIEQPGAERTPGNHCRFCPARSHCPEAGSWSLLPSVMTTHELVDRLTLQDCKIIWQRSSVITKILDEVKRRLKKLTDHELDALGLSRHAGRALDPIKDVRGAFNRLLDDLPAEEELWQLLSMSKGDLAKLLQKHKGMSADKAKLWIKTNLAQFIQEKTSEAYLEEKN